MNCSLWFGRCRVNNASEITEHFDMASLRGYFLGGSLAEWLREHGGEEQAERVSRLDPRDPELDRRLAEIFGQAPAAKNEVFTGAAAVGASADCGCGNHGSGWNPGSYAAGSGALYSGSGSYSAALGSFGYGSFSGGSFGGFRLWEWEWEWRFGYRSGSFSGSFRRGSFSGSFLGGSFAGGSFGGLSGGSFGGWLGSFSGSFPWGSFVFPGVGGSRFITADEYDRIMYMTLRRCPLDCFGYGIHIV